MTSSTPKSVLVTGGASGIGLAMARHFAAQGHRVAILDVNHAAGSAIATSLSTEYAQSPSITFHHCDVVSWDEQAAVFKHVYNLHNNRLDIVMANAGISEQGATTLVDLNKDPSEDPTKPSLKSLDVNLTGCIYSVKLATHYMHKTAPNPNIPPPTIICTASNAGLYAFPLAPLYAASKAGVIGLVRSTARFLTLTAHTIPATQPQVQINALAPAVLHTGMAPDASVFKDMVVTPMETLLRGVDKLLEPGVTGEVAEIHGESVTLRPPYDFVDEGSELNYEAFWKLGGV